MDLLENVFLQQRCLVVMYKMCLKCISMNNKEHKMRSVSAIYGVDDPDKKLEMLAVIINFNFILIVLE